MFEPSGTGATFLVILLLAVIVIGYVMILSPDTWAGVFYPSLKGDDAQKTAARLAKHGEIIIGGVIATVGGFLLTIGYRDWIMKGWKLKR